MSCTVWTIRFGRFPHRLLWGTVRMWLWWICGDDFHCCFFLVVVTGVTSTRENIITKFSAKVLSSWQSTRRTHKLRYCQEVIENDVRRHLCLTCTIKLFYWFIRYTYFTSLWFGSSIWVTVVTVNSFTVISHVSLKDLPSSLNVYFSPVRHFLQNPTVDHVALLFCTLSLSSGVVVPIVSAVGKPLTDHLSFSFSRHNVPAFLVGVVVSSRTTLRAPRLLVGYDVFLRSLL